MLLQPGFYEISKNACYYEKPIRNSLYIVIIYAYITNQANSFI